MGGTTKKESFIPEYGYGDISPWVLTTGRLNSNCQAARIPTGRFCLIRKKTEQPEQSARDSNKTGMEC